MDGIILQKQFDSNNTGQSSWNLDELVDQVRHSLHEEVDVSTIRLTLIDILSSYKDVPIRTFVPILACREAKEVLKK